MNPLRCFTLALCLASCASVHSTQPDHQDSLGQPSNPQPVASTATDSPDGSVVEEIDGGASKQLIAPPAALDVEHENGCFAWSSVQLAAACVVGSWSIAGGCSESVAFAGPGRTESHRVLSVPPQCLGDQVRSINPADSTRIASRLEEGNFKRIPQPGLLLETDGSVSLLGVGVELKRNKLRHVDHPLGTWDVYDVGVSLWCGGKRKRILGTTVENPSQTDVRGMETEPGWLLLTFQTAWGFEGDIGSSLSAVVVNTQTCKTYPMSAPPPPKARE